MSTQTVELRACVEFGGTVEQCLAEEAEFYGVYMGPPGALMWVADFDCYTDARNWAEECAENNELALIDRVELENIP